MASHKYYDLSSDDDDDNGGGGYRNGSSSSSSSEEEEDDDDVDMPSSNNGNSMMVSGQDPLWGRTILHLDIDCFYVQSEEIERGLRNSGKPIPPMAIGQKHIIVTSNYLARSLGVKKLQSKRDALQACPTLWIVDGSDLRHYRKHSRAVYEAFRKAMYELHQVVFRDNNDNATSTSSALSMEAATMKRHVPCVRGFMDEMMGELTTVVNKIAKEHDGGNAILSRLQTAAHSNETPHKLHIFGEDSSKSIELVEDQTGASATVSFRNSSHAATRNLSQSRRNLQETHNGNRLECERRLKIATQLARFVCSRIQQQTQFHTTVGISVSPLLAKLASGLTKPRAINVLLPWRSSELLYAMPLRKIPSIGHGTMKVLEGALRETMGSDGSESTAPCTVLDFLRLPREKILECLGRLQSGGSSESTCDLLLERCRGLDKSLVIDDEGAVTKTVSVENSFHRGTVKSMDKVWDELNVLFVRLPELLQDRENISSHPKLAYPSTLRVTVRILDPSLRGRKRRPFVTRSKQMAINGKALTGATDATKKTSMLTEWVKPMVKTLLITERGTAELDLTRLNLAVTGFADTARQSAAALSLGSSNLQAFTNKRQPESKLPAKQPSSKKPKIKATRIDHFFFKKS